MRLSAAFTALSSLIRPPKSKGGKKGWWGRRQARNLARQLKAAMGADTAAKEAAATAAVLEEEVRRRQLEKEAAAAAADGKLGSSNAGIGGGGGAGGTTSSGAAAVAAAGPAPGAPGWRSESGLSEGDDPFASLADGLETGEAPADCPSCLGGAGDGCRARGASSAPGTLRLTPSLPCLLRRRRALPPSRHPSFSPHTQARQRGGRWWRSPIPS